MEGFCKGDHLNMVALFAGELVGMRYYMNTMTTVGSLSKVPSSMQGSCVMDIRIPEIGESIQEALLAKWFKKNGETVQKDEPLCEIETDKITMDINADSTGILSIQVKEGTTVKIGTVIGTISEQIGSAKVFPATQLFAAEQISPEDGIKATVSSPSIRREMREQGVKPDSITGTGKGGRITLNDLFSRIEGTDRQKLADTSENIPESPVSPVVPTDGTRRAAVEPDLSVRSEEAPLYDVRREERKPISPIRKRISERLVAVRQQTAMLTTFNEVDMTSVNAYREKYRDHFKLLHGVPLGLMPFFVKASVQALREFPAVNASIDNDDFVFYNYYDIGIAIGSEKGLVVPILRDADKLKYFEIDQAIAAYKEKITTNRLAISDLTGGTFSIRNGGF